jgi:Tol biopolymer transport system component
VAYGDVRIGSESNKNSCNFDGVDVCIARVRLISLNDMGYGYDPLTTTTLTGTDGSRERHDRLRSGHVQCRSAGSRRLERRSAGEGFDQFRHPRVSSDGTRLVTWVASESGINELWVYDLERKTRARLTVNGSWPIWSRDDRNITFQKDASIFIMPADDSRPATVLLEKDPKAFLFPLAWSRDGRTLVYSRPSAETNRDVYVLPAGGKPTPFLATTRDERSAMLSPDGHWMVYAVLEAGREEEVYEQRYPGPGDRTPVSVGGGREPVWSPAGDEIFYRSIDGHDGCHRTHAAHVERRAAAR